MTSEKPIYIYDDTGKQKERHKVEKILFENERVILCMVLNEPIMIMKGRNEVVSNWFRFYYAEN